MLDNLKKTLEVLKQRIRFNLDRIHENEGQIKKILKEPISIERSEKLNKHFGVNKRMITENNEALKIQKDIIHYLETYHSEIAKFPQITSTNHDSHQEILNSGITKIEISRDDYFQLTINKEIAFDLRHPYYEDKEFLYLLMDYFISTEDYEMCAYLSTIGKNQLTN